MEGGASNQYRYICVFPKAQWQDRILPQMRPLRPYLQAKLAGQMAQLPEVQESWIKILFLPREEQASHPASHRVQLSGQLPRPTGRFLYKILHKEERPRSCERGAGIRAGVYLPRPVPIVRQCRANSLTDTRTFQKCCSFCQWGSILHLNWPKGV